MTCFYMHSGIDTGDIICKQEFESLQFEQLIASDLIQIIREGKTTGLRGIIIDMTERKQMESEKNLLQDIFESSLDCIATTDLHGYTQFASPKMQEVLGYEQNEIIGKKIHFLYANEVDDAKKIMKELTAKGELKNHEMKLRKKDGKLIDISLSASFLRSGNSEVIGTLGIFRDITEKKRLDAQLKEAGKMEAIETLAGGIAHDFNNLLMGMQGNASSPHHQQR